MTPVVTLLTTLKTLQIKLALDEKGDLVVRGDKTALTPALVAQIRQHKPEIVNTLRQNTGGNVPAITRVPRGEQPLLLSFAQQRLWLLDQIDGGSAHYNITGALNLLGALNIQALELSFDEIIKRHESLRTSFVEENNQVVQLIREAGTFKLTSSDCSLLAGQEQAQAVKEQIALEGSKVFDLSQDLMLRVHLIKCAPQQHVLVVTMHHIASDGWSMSVLIKEFSALYAAYSRGQASALPALEVQYADYAHWQRQYLKDEVLEQQLGYWQQQLADLPVVHGLPLDYSRPAAQSFTGKAVSSRLGREPLTALKTLCRGQGATLFMGLHAAFSVLLARYSNERDIVIGSPIANREQQEVAKLIGFFVNTLVLRSDLSQEPGFAALLQQSKQMLTDAYAHQQVPFEQLVERLQPERSLQHSPLFQVMLVLQNNEQQQLVLPELTLTPVAEENELAMFDLTLTAEEKDQQLVLHWEYNTDLFKEQTITAMAAHFEALVAALLARPQENVFKLPFIAQDQAGQQLSSGRVDKGDNLCIHEVFEQRVREQGQAIALELAGQELSYAQLNARANRLARYLVNQQGIKPGRLVGICLKRSIDMVVSILAVLKAGGAYVPLDPGYPAERLAYMLADAELEAILTDSTLQTPISEEQAVYLDREAVTSCVNDYEDTDLPVTATTSGADDLAYVIYTSGSTGQPKGVMVSHQNWQSYRAGAAEEYQMTANDKLVQFSSLSFDILVEELTLSLLSGGTLVLPGGDQVLAPFEFWQLVDRHQITLASLPTAYWHQLAEEESLAARVQNTSLRQVIVGGEAISPAHLTRWQQNAGQGIRLLNTYGPTEATVIASSFDVTTFDGGDKTIPIGKALNNSSLVILDKHLNLVPKGVIGELYIGGEGLARGYLNQAELSAEKFIKHPFANAPGERLYKTGDLVRWLDDGNLAFVGRIDHQVKIRGFRIELGEIEQKLREHYAVRDALVLAKEDEGGNKRLAAYVVTAGEQQPDVIANLRTWLKQSLPEYMLPGAYMPLAALPLTANGKLDVKALPEPVWQQAGLDYVAPVSATEQALCELWQEILGLERVGVTDNFFDLGGHSLLATRLVTQVNQVFALELAMQEIFNLQTVSELAASLDEQIQMNKLLSGELAIEDLSDEELDRYLALQTEE
ncbi:non-ribosomal peptide synthetase [Thalassomonas actiniarum]|uniref:Non-ribosomal peptide synthetase n=1 Tax=Thalassomonas actiniarum TaxID=485447 RepID=A0AAF0C2M9_9GAMM|nr:non-ribosomal peptide synthetase [Thalassomonas actiniarum]WDD98093.1 non-ribosomal peptide synthetase [Thalassomonas actiniarum]